MKSFRTLLLGTVFATSLIGLASQAQALSLQQAIASAVKTNPEIGQAVANREATEFELKQALGLYLPQVNLEASVGVEVLNNPSRRGAGIQDDPLYPSEVGASISYDIFDGGFRQAEANRQAARIDGASYRVLERSEAIGLEIARLYFEILLQSHIVDIARQNVSFHETTLSNVGDAISSGQLTEADRQQAQERLAAANSRMFEAQEALEVARIGFYKEVGSPFDSPTAPRRVGKSLPRTLEQAIDIARKNNPRIGMAAADIDAASAVVEQSQAGMLPKLSLEGRGVFGTDTSGAAGYTTDLQGRLVLKWNIFDGGIKSNEAQENIRRETEAMLAQQAAFREVEEAVRVSWSRINRQTQLATQYAAQMAASDSLVKAYREQFTIGQRSLLDVLDAQNSRFNAQVLNETAVYAARFAEYRLMASTGQLMAFLSVAPPAQADAYARTMLESPAADSYKDHKAVPVQFDRPLDLTKFVN
ncbi:Type I secretion system, outer membrane component LapE |nr:Type I secretion system, outer membrane component LapE \